MPGPAFRLPALLALLVLLVPAGGAAAQDDPAPPPPAPAETPGRLNGFALEPASVPVEEIRAGGPPRDGIPALDRPPAVAADEAPWPDEAHVLGVVVGGRARAYPLDLLVWHELVNDELGGVPILVSYCPLCGTALVFDRRVPGAGTDGPRTLQFGVSGLLYRSDLLMFDRETESLWSQIRAEAITGPLRGTALPVLRSRIQTWGAWRQRHPEGDVLGLETGHRRRYGTSPYGDYAVSRRLLFPVDYDERFHPKMPTLGLRTASGEARAYPAVELARAGGSVEETFAGHRVRVAYDPDAQVFDVEAPEGVQAIEGYWFAWAAFHPRTSVFQAPDDAP